MSNANPLVRAASAGLVLARQLADRGLAMVDPEVSRELSENGLSMVDADWGESWDDEESWTGEESWNEEESWEVVQPEPPPAEAPAANGSPDAYASMKTQLAVVSVLAQARGIDEAMEGVLAAIGEGFGWRTGAYWAEDEADGPLHCHAFWSAEGEDAEELERSVRAMEVQPDYLPRTDDAIATPLINGDEHTVLGVIEFSAPELQDASLEVHETLGAIAGQVAQYLGRKKAESAVEQLKDEFFGLVSHELRTPLTSIVGYTEMLNRVDGENLSDRGQSFVDVIRRNARREMRLVGDLLVLVRIQAGTFEIEPGTVDLNQVVEQSMETARLLADKANLDMTLETLPVRPCAGDAERLAQAFDNLLSNAVKFTPEGGSIRVRLRSDGDTAVFEVEDTGVGIPEEDHERLFDRLYRASSATKGHVPGTGLGLTIVKAIVEAHGGTVSVQSAEHEGSTFRITIPIRPLDEGSQDGGQGNGIPATAASNGGAQAEVVT